MIIVDHAGGEDICIYTGMGDGVSILRGSRVGIKGEEGAKMCNINRVHVANGWSWVCSQLLFQRVGSRSKVNQGLNSFWGMMGRAECSAACG